MSTHWFQKLQSSLHCTSGDLDISYFVILAGRLLCFFVFSQSHGTSTRETFCCRRVKSHLENLGTKFFEHVKHKVRICTNFNAKKHKKVW
jgi:hypothetical protein